MFSVDKTATSTDDGDCLKEEKGKGTASSKQSKPATKACKCRSMKCATCGNCNAKHCKCKANTNADEHAQNLAATAATTTTNAGAALRGLKQLHTPEIWIAEFDMAESRDDELKFNAKDEMIITHKNVSGDGWWMGYITKCDRTGAPPRTNRTGYVPSNYLEPADPDMRDAKLMAAMLSSEEYFVSNVPASSTVAASSPSPVPSSAEKSDASDSEDYCRRCDKGGEELLCCETCPAVYHLFCLEPKLTTIPEDDWYCPDCARTRAKKEHAKQKEKAKREGGGSAGGGSSESISPSSAPGKSNRIRPSTAPGGKSNSIRPSSAPGSKGNSSRPSVAPGSKSEKQSEAESSGGKKRKKARNEGTDGPSEDGRAGGSGSHDISDHAGVGAGLARSTKPRKITHVQIDSDDDSEATDLNGLGTELPVEEIEPHVPERDTSSKQTKVHIKGVEAKNRGNPQQGDGKLKAAKLHSQSQIKLLTEYKTGPAPAPGTVYEITEGGSSTSQAASTLGGVTGILYAFTERARFFFFRQEFTPEDASGTHACSLEANMRVTNGMPLGSSLSYHLTL
jgi:hypothetical protein